MAAGSFLFCTGVVTVSADGSRESGDDGGGVRGATRSDGEIVAGVCSTFELTNASESICNSSEERSSENSSDVEDDEGMSGLYVSEEDGRRLFWPFVRDVFCFMFVGPTDSLLVAGAAVCLTLS
jgi:hypothetical protein